MSINVFHHHPPGQPYLLVVAARSTVLRRLLQLRLSAVGKSAMFLAVACGHGQGEWLHRCHVCHPLVILEGWHQEISATVSIFGCWRIIRQVKSALVLQPLNGLVSRPLTPCRRNGSPWGRPSLRSSAFMDSNLCSLQEIPNERKQFTQRIGHWSLLTLLIVPYFLWCSRLIFALMFAPTPGFGSALPLAGLIHVKLFCSLEFCDFSWEESSRLL